MGSLLPGNPFANNLKDGPRRWRETAYACICKLNLGSALHNGDFMLSDLKVICLGEDLIYRPGTIGIDRIRPDALSRLGAISHKG
jgi:hypothetical protein